MELKNCFLTGLLVSAAVCVGAQGQNQTRGLHSLFVASGKLFFGTATDTNVFDDLEYLRIANDASEFGLWVPENSQKWQPTEPTEGKFAFTDPDLVALGSRENGQMFRCHTLTWHSQLPDFVQTTVWTRQALTAAIQAHIANVVGHYKGQCYSWDVVNEALNDNGTFRNDVFFQTMGTEYIPISFAAAAEADPAAKLYYNDFNLETAQAKADGAVGIVRMLQAAGIRIDGLGFQAHLNVGLTPNQTALTATLTRFTAMGLEVAYTELDIAHTQLPADAVALQQQARDYVNVVGSCLAVAECVGIVVWEFTDKYSWIPDTFPGKGDACLYDADFNQKPAYTSIANLLAAAASGGVGVNGTTPSARPRPSGTVLTTAVTASASATATLNNFAAQGNNGDSQGNNDGPQITANDPVLAATTLGIPSGGSTILGRSGGLGALLLCALGGLSLFLLL